MTSAATGSAPAIVGAAQVLHEPGARPLEDACGPIELMTEAVRAAAADAGADRLLARVGFVGVAGGLFRHTNPGQLVAARIGSPGAATALAAVSGTGPQDLVGLAAQRIARGELDIAVVVGGEARWSALRMKAQGIKPTWESAPGEGAPEATSAFAPEAVAELAMFAGAAPAYALIEDRIRARRDESVDAHRDRIARLWESFSAVASANPYAWDRTPHTAAEIRNPAPDNRMIAFPYTKAMVANNTVDMASAVILCSVHAARSIGIADDRLIFPHVIAQANETWLVAARHDLGRSPALAAAGRAAYGAARIGPDDIAHVDLYACFPSIVQMSATALKLGVDRALTVTGGLGFAGAAIGNAAGHSITAMVARLRAGGAGYGLVHANGGVATKHSVGLYAAHPPAGFELLDVQDRVDLRAREVLADNWSGPLVVEAATVRYDRDGPAQVLACGLDKRGARGWLHSTEPAMFAAVHGGRLTGAAVHRSSDGVARW